MKLGLFQVPSLKGATVEERVDTLHTLMEQCYQRGADIAFTPEAWQYTDVRGDKETCVRLARTHAPRTLSRAGALAKKYKAYVCQWEYDVDEAGNLYNAMYILDRHGERVGIHRKTHLTYGEREKMNLSFGADHEVFDLDFGKVGILICFENYFPEPARIMGAKGAQLLLYSLAGDNKMPFEQWEIKLRARAIDSCLYIASEQRALYDPAKRQTAFTGLVDPSGSVLGKLNESGEVKVFDIDLNRRKIDCLAGDIPADMRTYLDISRRPELYEPLLQKNTVTDWKDVLTDRI